MCSLKVWISKPHNRKQVGLDELQIVLDEVNSNAVGIKASGIMTVTYGVVANVL